MWLDIGIGVFLLIGMGLGWRKGFMNGIIGFISGIVSFVIAIFTAGPVANLLDGFINLSGRLLVLISGVIVYVICRLVFWGLSRLVHKIKDNNRVIDKLDRIGGIFLGLAKYTMTIIMVFVVIYLLSSVKFMSGPIDWLFDKSVIGKFIYSDIVIKLIVPLLGDLAAWVLERV